MDKDDESCLKFLTVRCYEHPPAVFRRLESAAHLKELVLAGVQWLAHGCDLGRRIRAADAQQPLSLSLEREATVPPLLPAFNWLQCV